MLTERYLHYDKSGSTVAYSTDVVRGVLVSGAEIAMVEGARMAQLGHASTLVFPDGQKLRFEAVPQPTR